MPRVATFNGIVIAMYFRDHSPAHVHAMFSGHEILVVIATGAVLQGSLPASQMADVTAYVAAHRDESLALWASFR